MTDSTHFADIAASVQIPYMLSYGDHATSRIWLIPWNSRDNEFARMACIEIKSSGSIVRNTSLDFDIKWPQPVTSSSVVIHESGQQGVFIMIPYSPGRSWPWIMVVDTRNRTSRAIHVPEMEGHHGYYYVGSRQGEYLICPPYGTSPGWDRLLKINLFTYDYQLIPVPQGGIKQYMTAVVACNNVFCLPRGSESHSGFIYDIDTNRVKTLDVPWWPRAWPNARLLSDHQYVDGHFIIHALPLGDDGVDIRQRLMINPHTQQVSIVPFDVPGDKKYFNFLKTDKHIIGVPYTRDVPWSWINRYTGQLTTSPNPIGRAHQYRRLSVILTGATEEMMIPAGSPNIPIIHAISEKSGYQSVDKIGMIATPPNVFFGSLLPLMKERVLIGTRLMDGETYLYKILAGEHTSHRMKQCLKI